MTTAVHRMIRDTAKGIAEAFYEEAVSYNDFYAAWPKQAAFVARNWKEFIQPARASLTKLLTMPSVDEAAKEKIVEALALDRDLQMSGLRFG